MNQGHLTGQTYRPSFSSCAYRRNVPCHFFFLDAQALSTRFGYERPALAARALAAFFCALDKLLDFFAGFGLSQKAFFCGISFPNLCKPNAELSLCLWLDRISCGHQTNVSGQHFAF